ncbi:hypothetical protein [Streptomyces adustus]|uniref:hypothetical protein n=1 Tax=Streptomyces adustus TaxID=1609272 RepID=UPI001EE48371|nr:hypothetical protein [Streptomyces adustus]
MRRPQDRRSSALRLTAEGEKPLAASRPIVEGELTSLTAVVPSDDLARIASTLAVLRADLEAGAHGQPG